MVLKITYNNFTYTIDDFIEFNSISKVDTDCKMGSYYAYLGLELNPIFTQDTTDCKLIALIIQNHTTATGISFELDDIIVTLSIACGISFYRMDNKITFNIDCFPI